MKSLLNTLEWVIDRLCTALLVLMVVVCFIQVFNRYVIGQVFFWAEEFTLYALIWMTFLGAAIAVRQDAHTKIDFFVNLLPLKGVKVMHIVAHLLCLGYILAISYLSITVVH
ncbi:MAG: TRAP transporter small permease, partial [Clostridium sp.]|nr:TRAP transporter small permease [Clostridium sp.]